MLARMDKLIRAISKIKEALELQRLAITTGVIEKLKESLQVYGESFDIFTDVMTGSPVLVAEEKINFLKFVSEYEILMDILMKNNEKIKNHIRTYVRK